MLLLDTPQTLIHFLQTFNSPFLHLQTRDSPHGFTCWLLLSSATSVYLLDAIKLRPHLRPSASTLRRALNERVLANPVVLKLVPDGFSAVKLQRDLGLYVVNAVSLAVEEEAQASDWHIRPINEGQVKAIGQSMHALRSTVPDTRAMKALYARNLEISRSMMPADTKPKAPETANKVEDAIRRWRADIA